LRRRALATHRVDAAIVAADEQAPARSGPHARAARDVAERREREVEIGRDPAVRPCAVRAIDDARAAHHRQVIRGARRHKVGQSRGVEVHEHDARRSGPIAERDRPRAASARLDHEERRHVAMERLRQVGRSAAIGVEARHPLPHRLELRRPFHLCEQPFVVDAMQRPVSAVAIDEIHGAHEPAMR
jgi:hypothetical protein